MIAICEHCNIDFDEYFEEVPSEKKYAVETLKGYRRILRTLFNEAVRYECAGSSNTSLRAVPEKEVFSFAETREFIARLNELPPEDAPTEQKLIADIFGQIFALCSSVTYDDGVFNDYLGELFMKCNQSNKHAGQFFTP